MFLIVLTFVLTTAVYGLLIWLGCRRVLRRVQGDEAAVKAITEFVLIPLLGRSPEDDDGETPYDAQANGQAPSASENRHKPFA
jgi:hypothetical protein